MTKKTYESNFVDAVLNITCYIENWPKTFNKEKLVNFQNLKNAPMIYIPVLVDDNKEIISREHFYCSECAKWLQVSGSVRNINRHAALHLPDFFKDNCEDDDKTLITKKQEEILIKNIVCFVIFETNAFSLIESPFLNNVIPNLPNRNKLLIALKNISMATQKEIKYRLSYSACSCLAHA